ncbi:MAG: ribose 5-phosphate isomerase B [Calditrichaceae bacterium]
MKNIIVEADVRKAARDTNILLIGDRTVITPAARDLAKEKGVKFEKSAQSDPGTLFLEQGPNQSPVKTIALASDHGGFAMKQELKTYIEKLGYQVHDLGPANDKACDYPDYAFKVAEMVSAGKTDRGIMIDSVGIGSAMAANRVKGVLAAKCNNAFEARSSREHNYANYLTFGAKIIGIEIAKEIVKVFLETHGGAIRHQKRIEKILEYSK